MADNKSQAPVIIIRRKKKGGGHGGHHGGAWKVAYADFVTAMMAFFLLLWLLNVTTDIQRKGIADYFAPASISKSESGAGGFMGGQTITVEGQQISEATPVTTQEVTVPTVGQGDEGDEDTKGKDSTSPNGQPGTGNATLSKDEQAMVGGMRAEEDAFKAAETALKEAITSNPELRDFSNQIAIDRTPEGLRIQIIDQDKFSMFPSGGAVPYERGRDLLRLVGKVIGKLPNNISVTGHTDSTPFTAGSTRDNFTLSTERANISRSYIVEGGVDEKRVARVAGLADRDPFVPNNAKDPRNRRISIVLLRQSIPPATTPADAAPGQESLPAAPPASMETNGPASEAPIGK